jgi:alpha-beta hydrolase superfamily lysophospholipase
MPPSIGRESGVRMGTSSVSQGRFSEDRLAYRVWDVADPKAIVVIAHGYAEHSGRYDHVGRALAEASLASWALDHAGHGLSKGDERGNAGEVEDAVADMDEFVTMASASAPSLPVFLVGHSMGAMLSLAYSEQHQDRLTGLVVTGAAVVLGDMITELLALEEIPAVPLGAFVSRDPEVAAAYDNDPLNYHGAMPRELLQKAPERIEAVRSKFATITIPILAMHGEQDALAPMQASLDVITGVSSGDRSLRIWPGLYHEIFNEPEKDRVIGEVVRWITERLPAT